MDSSRDWIRLFRSISSLILLLYWIEENKRDSVRVMVYGFIGTTSIICIIKWYEALIVQTEIKLVKMTKNIHLKLLYLLLVGIDFGNKVVCLTACFVNVCVRWWEISSWLMLCCFHSKLHLSSSDTYWAVENSLFKPGMVFCWIRE